MPQVTFRITELEKSAFDSNLAKKELTKVEEKTFEDGNEHLLTFGNDFVFRSDNAFKGIKKEGYEQFGVDAFSLEELKEIFIDFAKTNYEKLILARDSK